MVLEAGLVDVNLEIEGIEEISAYQSSGNVSNDKHKTKASMQTKVE